MPFAVLPGRAREDGEPSFLIEDMTLVHFVSGADLLRSKRFPFRPASDGLLALGGVRYDAARGEKRPGPSPTAGDAAGRGDEAGLVAMRGGSRCWVASRVARM